MIPLEKNTVPIARRNSTICSRIALFERRAVDASEQFLPAIKQPPSTTKSNIIVDKKNERFTRRASTGRDVPLPSSRLSSKTNSLPSGPKDTPAVKMQRRASTGMAVSRLYISRTGSQVEKLNLQRKMAARRIFEAKQATRIQQAFRSFQQRRRMKLALLQKRIQRRAAIKLQAFSRTIVPRLQLRLFQMEQKLKKIDRQRVADLKAIQTKLEYDMAKYRAKELVKKQRASQQDTMRTKECNKLVHYLRKENKKLRNKNDTLRRAMKHEFGHFQDLLHTKQIIDQNYALLVERAANVEETHKLARASEQEHKLLLAEFQAEAERIRQICITERHVRETCDRCLKSVILKLTRECYDEDLVSRVVQVSAVA